MATHSRCLCIAERAVSSRVSHFSFFFSVMMCALRCVGKGDLVGCDISVHLVASSNGQGSGSHNSGGNQEVLVKSSSDVKVCTSPRRKTSSFDKNAKIIVLRSVLLRLTGFNLLWFEMYTFGWIGGGAATVSRISARIRQWHSARFDVQHARRIWGWGAFSIALYVKSIKS